LRVDDERRALRDPFLVEDAERAAQVLADVGEHRERQAFQILVVAPPGEMHELAVDRAAEHLRVAVREVAMLLAELGDLRRTDEREVLRPEEDHEPLAGIASARDGLEGGVQVLGHGGLQRKLGKLVAYGQHRGILLETDAIGYALHPTGLRLISLMD